MPCTPCASCHEINLDNKKKTNVRCDLLSNMRDALNKPVGRSNDNAKYVGLSSLDKYGKNKIDKKNIVV